MLLRTTYIQKLLSWKDKQIIKVLTGMRRVGKSTVLKQYKEELLQSGVEEEQIIFLHLDRIENESLHDYHKLNEHILKLKSPGKKTYLMLDEIQLVQGFEKVLNSLLIDDEFDIYVTGSNSYILSSELGTYLSGRYIQIHVLPFSFSEFMQAQRELTLLEPSPSELFEKYIILGGMPFLACNLFDDEQARAYLDDVFHSVVVKDIIDRIRTQPMHEQSSRPTYNPRILVDMASYLAKCAGSLIVSKNISSYLTSAGRKTSTSTADSYLKALCDAYVFYELGRADINGKEYLRGTRKYYPVDLGIRNNLVNDKSSDLGFKLESIVYFELLRRGYSLNVAKVGELEIDFVAENGDERLYIQVCASLLDEPTFQREIKPLESMRNNYEKIVLTLDRLRLGNHEGIRIVNLIDWLLN